MNRAVIIAAAAALFSGPALAEGDAAKGEEVVAKRCKSCHMIQNGDDTILKGGKVGPNLYGVIGRQAGTEADYSRYGDDLVAAGERGLVWDEAQIMSYLEDPKAFLAAYLEDDGARSKMNFKLRKDEDRADAAAYLASVSE